MSGVLYDKDFVSTKSDATEDGLYPEWYLPPGFRFEFNPDDTEDKELMELNTGFCFFATTQRFLVWENLPTSEADNDSLKFLGRSSLSYSSYNGDVFVYMAKFDWEGNSDKNLGWLVDVYQFSNVISNKQGIVYKKMSFAFNGAKHVEKIWAFDDTNTTPRVFDLSNQDSLESTFAGCENFNQQLSWNTSNITKMAYTFRDCASYNQSINWDGSNVTTTQGMFQNAKKLNSSVSISLGTNCKDTSRMFFGAESLNVELALGNTSSVEDMSRMFMSCLVFNQPLPLTFDTSSVEDMSSMFNSALKFNQNLPFTTDNVTNMDSMFFASTSGMFDQDISEWCVDQIPCEPVDFALNQPLGQDENEMLRPRWGWDCDFVKENNAAPPTLADYEYSNGEENNDAFETHSSVVFFKVTDSALEAQPLLLVEGNLSDQSNFSYRVWVDLKKHDLVVTDGNDIELYRAHLNFKIETEVIYRFESYGDFSKNDSLGFTALGGGMTLCDHVVTAEYDGTVDENEKYWHLSRKKYAVEVSAPGSTDEKLLFLDYPLTTTSKKIPGPNKNVYQNFYHLGSGLLPIDYFRFDAPPDQATTSYTWFPSVRCTLLKMKEGGEINYFKGYFLNGDFTNVIEGHNICNPNRPGWIPSKMIHSDFDGPSSPYPWVIYTAGCREVFKNEATSVFSQITVWSDREGILATEFYRPETSFSIVDEDNPSTGIPPAAPDTFLSGSVGQTVDSYDFKISHFDIGFRKVMPFEDGKDHVWWRQAGPQLGWQGSPEGVFPSEPTNLPDDQTNPILKPFDPPVC